MAVEGGRHRAAQKQARRHRAAQEAGKAAQGCTGSRLPAAGRREDDSLCGCVRVRGHGGRLVEEADRRMPEQRDSYYL
jgi:hypothetical protein